MYYGDHNPPHFHVRYAQNKAVIAINSLSVIEGRLPPRALGLAMEWASMHQVELLDDWARMKNMEPLSKIDPLE